ncbi:MAG: isochorismatase family protein, partial [Variovorax sp.]
MRIDDARPFPYEFDLEHTALVLIDMQRDFIEPDGFGASLGNDVSLLEAIVPAKRDRGHPTLRIGDVGPMGRVLVRGEPGSRIIDALAPV